MQGLHDRLATLLPNLPPLLSGAAADLRLDPVEISDLSQRLFGQGRARGLVDLIEPTSTGRPAEGDPDLTRPVHEQALEATVAVHLQDTVEVSQMLRRVLALTILGIEV